MNSNRSIRIVLLTAILAALCCVTGCELRQRLGQKSQKTDEWQPPRIVTIEGVDECMKFIPQGGYITDPEPHEDQDMSLLLRHGDLLIFDNDFILPYDSSDSSNLSIETDSCRIRLDGQTVSLMLSEEPGCWEWLAEAEPHELATIRLLYIEAMDSSRMGIIERLAGINSAATVLFEEDSTTEETLFSLFRPKIMIAGEDLPTGGIDDLPPKVWRETEVLHIMDAVEIDSLLFLAELPNLRTVSMAEWEPERTGGFPAGMERLRYLSINASDIINLTDLENLSGLQQLDLVGEAANLGVLHQLPHLRGFTLTGTVSDSLDMHALQGLKGFRWLGLPMNTTQEQFAAIIPQHPDLVGLELVECDSIGDLTPLTSLRELKYLIMLPTDLDHVDYKPMGLLTSLRYLMLPIEAFEDTLGRIDTLKQALPEAVIVPGSGFCLGSGWILALLPGVVVAWGVRRLRR